MNPFSKTSKVGQVDQGGPKWAMAHFLTLIPYSDKDHEKWTASQPETYPKEDTYAAAGADLLAEFLGSCKAQGRSQQALIGLRNRVPRLFAYLDEISLDLFALKVKDTQGYIGWLSARRATRSGTPLSARTVASYFEAASSFYEYLKHQRLRELQPLQGDQAGTHGEEDPPRPLEGDGNGGASGRARALRRDGAP